MKHSRHSKNKSSKRPVQLVSRDILSRISACRSKMSKSELRIADIVYNDVEFAVHATTAKLAAAASVSLPTITRFCQTIGCDGVMDFKLSLAKSMTVGKRYLPHNSSVELRNLSNTATKVLSGIHHAIEQLGEQLDMDKLLEAAMSIARAKRIFVFGGGGGSSSIAQDTEYRLFRLGVKVTCCNDTQLQYMMAATLTHEDVLLVISTSGRYLELVKAASIARQYDAQVIALTAPNSPLAETASLSLTVSIPEQQEDILLPTSSRYALLAIVDIIASLTAKQLGGKAAENLRRIKYQLVTLRDGNDNLPLGD